TVGGAGSSAGPLFGPGNLISGNDGGGIAVGASSGANSIIGNLIGTDISGTLVLPNGGPGGISILTAPTNTIQRNVISGNTSDGIAVSGGSGHAIFLNSIGTDVTGPAATGNTGDGVSNTNSSGNTVTANWIRSNGGDGIDVTSGNHNDLTSNESIFGNGGLGIRLGSGANGSQSFPALSLLSRGPSSVTVTVTLTS